MKRIRIDAGKIGLVVRKGRLRKVIPQGAYWLNLFDLVYEYDLARPLHTSTNLPYSLNLLVKDEMLQAYITIQEVGDNEIVLLYADKNFKEVLGGGRYVFWKGLIDYDFSRIDLSQLEIKGIDKDTLTRKEVLPYIRIYDVMPYEKGVLFVDGKFEKVLESGSYFYWKNATPISIVKADMRMLQLEVSGQEILTRDKAALRINFNTQYKVVDVEKALIENKDYEKQLYALMQLALREYVGTFSLDELLENKEGISDYVMKTLEAKAKELGVRINGCGVKDVILPGEVKEIMSQVMIAQKKAQAHVIMRREETASTRSLLNTAKLMEDNAMLYKLKEMEYVEKIAEKIGEITVAGNGQVVDQLKSIFAPAK